MALRLDVVEHTTPATFRMRRKVDFDLSNWTLYCQIRRGETLVDDAETTVISPATLGEFEVSVQHTDGWPEGILETDIRFVNGAEEVITETIIIKVKKGRTQ